MFKIKSKPMKKLLSSQKFTISIFESMTRELQNVVNPMPIFFLKQNCHFRAPCFNGINLRLLDTPHFTEMLTW